MKLFRDDCNNMSNLNFTDYSAGGITEDGVIAYYQTGAEKNLFGWNAYLFYGQ